MMHLVIICGTFKYIAHSVNVISERPSFVFIDSVLSVCTCCTANRDTTFVVLQPNLKLACHCINDNSSENLQRLILGGLQQGVQLHPVLQLNSSRRVDVDIFEGFSGLSR